MHNQRNLAKELEQTCQKVRKQGVKTTIKSDRVRGEPNNITCRFENGNEIEATKNAVSWDSEGYSTESHLTPSQSDKVILSHDKPNRAVKVQVSGDRGIDSQHTIRGE